MTLRDAWGIGQWRASANGDVRKKVATHDTKLGVLMRGGEGVSKLKPWREMFSHSDQAGDG